MRHSILLVLLLAPGCALAEKEFGPEALLRKYEVFKDEAAALDAKRASIHAAETRTKGMDKTYAGIPRSEWPRADLEQYNLWTTEVAGMKASYNTLAARYNAQMAKENYRFCNVGELPKGASTPLPREFKTYLEE